MYLSELGGSSINWSVRVWTKTSDYWAVKERLTTAVKQALDEHETGMPYPQRDVHLDELAPTDGQEDLTPRESDSASSA